MAETEGEGDTADVKYPKEEVRQVLLTLWEQEGQPVGTVSMIVDRLGGSRPTIRARLHELVEDGDVDMIQVANARVYWATDVAEAIPRDRLSLFANVAASGVDLDEVDVEEGTRGSEAELQAAVEASHQEEGTTAGDDRGESGGKDAIPDGGLTFGPLLLVEHTPLSATNQNERNILRKIAEDLKHVIAAALTLLITFSAALAAWSLEFYTFVEYVTIIILLASVYGLYRLTLALFSSALLLAGVYRTDRLDSIPFVSP